MILRILKSPAIGLVIVLGAIAVFTAFGPAEKSLGTNVRIVYLHGVWVWTALAAFTLAALVGVIAFLKKRRSLHLLSRALGRTGLVFWITYLPISMWAMQTNWNGLFLSEPRWKMAAVFALSGILLQIGVTLMGNPAWASAGNVVFWLALVFVLQGTENVMHPGSAIFGSGAFRIQIYFSGLLLLAFLAGWQVTRGWCRLTQH